jgi:hypothetical protein
MKKARKTSLAIRKTPKPKRKSSEAISPTLPSRKSTRTSNAITYAEASSDEDDVEMEENDRVASSPVSAKKGKAVSRAKTKHEEAASDSLEDEDEEMKEVREESAENEEVHVHEDEDTHGGAEDVVPQEDQEGEEEQPSPSLKGKSNAGQKQTHAKGKKSTPTKKSAPLKSTPEKVPRTTRQTRSSKS